MRRKIIAIALCVMMMVSALCLASCGAKEGSFVGEWKSNDATWGEVVLNLTEDNKVEFTMLDIPTEGTWVYNEEEKNITVTTDQFEDFEVAEEDGALSFEFGDGKITLEKVE